MVAPCLLRVPCLHFFAPQGWTPAGFTGLMRLMRLFDGAAMADINGQNKGIGEQIPSFSRFIAEKARSLFKLNDHGNSWIT